MGQNRSRLHLELAVQFIQKYNVVRSEDSRPEKICRYKPIYFYEIWRISPKSSVARIEKHTDARLARGVACVLDQFKCSFRPSSVQLPGAFHRTDDIIAPLDDDGWNIPDSADMLDEPIIGLKKTMISKIVAFDSRELERLRGRLP